MILDSHPISTATKNDLQAPTRYFLWYAEQLGIKPQFIDDTIVMSFLIDEGYLLVSGTNVVNLMST